MQQLAIKEQGFRNEIDTLKLENKNLKEKYTNNLTKIQKELDTYKDENEQLEKEMKDIQDELVKNGNANEALINQLNTKQTQIKGLKSKINTLEANETQLQEIIKQKDEEIAQLQQKVQEQAEQIIKLTAEIEANMETFKQQAIRIQQLEGAIAGLESASSSLGGNNKELLHEIEKLKNQLKNERDEWKELKKKLDEKIVDLNSENLVLSVKKETLRKEKEKWEEISNTTTSNQMLIGGAVGVGAAIGSIVPGVGTVVGGAVGFIAGSAGDVVNTISSKWDVVKGWFGW